MEAYVREFFRFGNEIYLRSLKDNANGIKNFLICHISFQHFLLNIPENFRTISSDPYFRLIKLKFVLHFCVN